MANQTTFERIEKKYLLTPAQFEALWPILLRTMQVDQYGRHTICNIYYDTPDYALIRASLDRPVYKEKLRLRSYGVPGDDSTVFLEIKKKFKGVVYKRREAMTLAEARQYTAAGVLPGHEGQIVRELDFFLRYWQPVPKVFLAYDRIALFSTEDSELRITFDTDIRWRTGGLDLAQGDAGAPLPMDAPWLMEVKIPDAMPLWMARAFSLLGIYPVTVSKYGRCYAKCLLPRLAAQGEQRALTGALPAAGPAADAKTQKTGGIYCA